jgi:enoyl-CoA hydratase/carnithine racemase
MTDARVAADRADHNRVTVEADGPVLVIGLNRADKRNAADFRMLTELASAYGRLEREPELRCAVVFAHGDHFTAGLDLADVAPRIGPDGLDAVPEDRPLADVRTGTQQTRRYRRAGHLSHARY